jgi:Secretion system C-terminal sorting domain
MKYLYKFQFLTFITFSIAFSLNASGQTCEWRLTNATYSSVDPDGAGPAVGSVTFTMQIHTTSGTITNVNTISTGSSYQSANFMIPTTPGCAVVSSPANVTVSAAFTTGGFAYTTVNQCGAFSQMAGGQNFDTRTVGTLDGTAIDISTSWIDVYTVTLWTLNSNGGYVIINSSDIGTPGPFSSYAVADNLANEYAANSLTFDTPLLLGPTALPVLFTKFEAGCTSNGAVVSWSTASEFNSNYFELQRSMNGSNWASVATIKAAGNSSIAHTYQLPDFNGGKAFYRIKQVDIDGQPIYTSVIGTNCKLKAIDMVIYPVPATDILNVVIRSDKAIKTQLLVIDGIGKIVRRMDATLSNGSNSYQFNLKGLAGGEYIIRSNAPGVELNKTFNIIR